MNILAQYLQTYTILIESLYYISCIFYFYKDFLQIFHHAQQLKHIFFVVQVWCIFSARREIHLNARSEQLFPALMARSAVVFQTT
jgi:hypothetical protein